MSRFGDDAGVGPIEATAGSVILSSDNLDAIRAYFSITEVKTPEAQKIKNAFVTWYDGLWFYEKYTLSTLDLARNQRNRFNLANAMTPEEKQVVQTVLTTGMTSEQTQGQPDRRDETGMLPGPVAPPPPPLIPKPYLIGGAIVGGLALIVFAYGEGRK